MDEINWSLTIILTFFLQTLNACLAAIYLENVEAYENDTTPEVENATNRAERKGG